MQEAVVIVMLAIIAISIRVFSGQCDRERIREFIRSQGGEVLNARWSPFGAGWQGERGERIYEVKYRDAAGQTHDVTIKTSRLSGIFVAGDHLIQKTTVANPNSSDREMEIASLRQRLAELEKQNTSADNGNA